MTTNPTPGTPEDMNELYDAQIDRVDLVGAAANGHRFLLAKNAAGLVTPDAIRDLLKEMGAEDADAAAAGLVMNADPLNPPPTTIEKESEMADQITPETAAAPETVTKETEQAAETVEKTADAAPTAPVAKADSMLAVFDRCGNLIGVVDPDAVTPVDGGEAPDTGDGDSDMGDDADKAAVNPTEADGSSAIDGHDYGTDGDSRVIPGTDTVQSPVEKDGPKPKKGKKNVTKTADLAAVLKEAIAPLVKQIEDLTGENDVLKGRVDAMGREPDDRNSPLIGGGTGAAAVAKRGADQEDAFAVFEKAVKDAEASGNPANVIVAKQQLQHAKIRALYPND